MDIDELRDRLHELSMERTPSSGGLSAVVRRGRARSRRRRAAVAGLAAVVVAGVAGVVVQGHQESAVVEVTTEPVVIAPAEPVALEWTTTEGGPAAVFPLAIGPDGAVLGLGRQPAAEQFGPQARPSSLVSLADGSWSEVLGPLPVALGDEALAIDERAHVIGLQSDPDQDRATGLPRMFSGSEGGAWVEVDLPEVRPPSDDVRWTTSTFVGVASAPGSTIAAIGSESVLSYEEVQDEVVDLPGVRATVDYRSSGVAIMVLAPDELERYDHEVTSTPETTAPVVPPQAEEVAVRSWEDLGVDGPEALTTTSLLVDRGDGWAEVEAPDGMGVVDEVRALDGEVLLSSRPAPANVGPTAEIEGPPRWWATTDGTAWRSFTAPAGPAPIVAMGDIWVQVPVGRMDLDVVHVSSNRGVSWEPRPLSPPGVDGQITVGRVSGGPLGLYLLATVFSPDGLRIEGEFILATRDLEDWSATRTDQLFSTWGLLSDLLVAEDLVVVQQGPRKEVVGPGLTAVGRAEGSGAVPAGPGTGSVP